jgi:hypothetical protein
MKMNGNEPTDWPGIPGAELVRQGLEDLAAHHVTETALLVLVAEPRLRALNVVFPDWRPRLSSPVTHELYNLIEEQREIDPYTRYNSLLRRMNSFAHALEQRANSGATEVEQSPTGN